MKKKQIEKEGRNGEEGRRRRIKEENQPTEKDKAPMFLSSIGCTFSPLLALCSIIIIIIIIIISLSLSLSLSLLSCFPCYFCRLCWRSAHHGQPPLHAITSPSRHASATVAKCAPAAKSAVQGLTQTFIVLHAVVAGGGGGGGGGARPAQVLRMHREHGAAVLGTQ